MGDAVRNVGQAVLRVIQSNGHSQRRTAINADMDPAALFRLINDPKRDPRLSTLWKLADAAGVSLDELVGRKPPAA